MMNVIADIYFFLYILYFLVCSIACIRRERKWNISCTLNLMLDKSSTNLVFFATFGLVGASWFPEYKKYFYAISYLILPIIILYMYKNLINKKNKK